MSRRLLLFLSFTSTAALFFLLGVWHAQNTDALDRETYDAKLDAIRAEVRSELARPRAVAGDVALPAATSGEAEARTGDPAGSEATPSAAARARMVAPIKQELQN